MSIERGPQEEEDYKLPLPEKQKGNPPNSIEFEKEPVVETIESGKEVLVEDPKTFGQNLESAELATNKNTESLKKSKSRWLKSLGTVLLGASTLIIADGCSGKPPSKEVQGLMEEERTAKEKTAEIRVKNAAERKRNIANAELVLEEAKLKGDINEIKQAREIFEGLTNKSERPEKSFSERMDSKKPQSTWQERQKEAQDRIRGGLGEIHEKAEQARQAQRKASGLIKEKAEQAKQDQRKANEERTKEKAEKTRQAEIEKINELLPKVREGEFTEIFGLLKKYPKAVTKKVLEESKKLEDGSFLFTFGDFGSYELKSEQIREIMGDLMEYDYVSGLIGSDYSKEIEKFKGHYITKSIIDRGKNQGTIIKTGNILPKEMEASGAKKDFEENQKRSREKYIKNLPNIVKECKVTEGELIYKIDFNGKQYEIDKDKLEEVVPTLRGIVKETAMLSETPPKQKLPFRQPPKKVEGTIEWQTEQIINVFKSLQ